MRFRQLMAMASLTLVSLFIPQTFAEESAADQRAEVIEIILEEEVGNHPIEAPIFLEADEIIEAEEGVLSKELKLYVKFETTQGDFIALLDANRAPNTVGNFIEYVNESFYDGLIFHRVIDGFMIQGGGYDETMAERATRIPVSIESKNGLKNHRGSLAMARTADPNSATSQFFINLVENPFLDYPGHDGYGYTVFGHVVEGMEVVDRIAKLETESYRGHEDLPIETVLIKRAYLIDPPESDPTVQSMELTNKE